MSEQRAQRIAEQILENESLADDLDDAEATSLIEWGLAVSRRLCDQTTGMDDAQAEEHLYPPLKNLRRVMRRINRLAGSPSAETPEMVAGRLSGIFEAASEIPVLKVTPPEDIEAVARLVRMSPPGDALAKVLSYLPFEEISDHGKEKT